MYETYYHKNKKFRVKSMPRIILILAKNCRKTMTSQPTTAWMLGIVQALKSTHFFTAVREFPLSTVILLATLTLSTKKSKGQHLYSIMMERAWRMESTRTLTSSSGENRTDSYSVFSYPCGGWFCFGIGAHSVPRSGDFSAQGSYYWDRCLLEDWDKVLSEYWWILWRMMKNSPFTIWNRSNPSANHACVYLSKAVKEQLK